MSPAVLDVSQRAAETRSARAATQVIAIWSSVLECEIDPEDNFFDIGGTALDAVIAGTRMSKEFGIRLPLRCIFENPTVRAIVPVLLDHQDQAAEGNPTGP